jgi:hypothetical protein
MATKVTVRLLEETKMAAMGKGEEAADQYLAEGRLS